MQCGSERCVTLNRSWMTMFTIKRFALVYVTLYRSVTYLTQVSVKEGQDKSILAVYDKIVDWKLYFDFCNVTEWEYTVVFSCIWVMICYIRGRLVHAGCLRSGGFNS